MTGDAKIESVERQLAAISDQRTNTINCPYCNRHTLQEQPFCCKTLMKAIRAILEREARQELADAAEKIAENVSRMVQ
jgi:hypothetical protein